MRKIKTIIKVVLKILVVVFIISIIDIVTTKVTTIHDISKQNSIEIYDNENNIIYETNNLHEASYIELTQINLITRQVFVEIEDRRFFSHPGFDPISIVHALYSNITSKTTIGASTITQQYVKNLYLSSEQTYIRKLKEIYYAVKIENIYSKDEILEGYLNTIYFNNGQYGIYDASVYYFNTTPDQLTLKQSACLAAIIKAPTYYCPINNYEANSERTKLILQTLLDRDVITKSEYNQALNEKLTFTQTIVEKYSTSVLFFKDYVLSQVEQNKNEMKIYTNFDSQINSYLDELLKDELSCNVSVVILDKQGYVVSIIGNKSYSDSSYNIATGNTRMIGSTVKPMLYYQALEYNMESTSTFKSEETTFYIETEPLTIHNFNDSYENDYISMAYALATSDNIYAMKTHLFIGPDKLNDFYKKFDLTIENDIYTAALGTETMPLIKLASIYQTFQNLGNYYEPKGYTNITSNDEIIVSKAPIFEEKLNANTCFIINDLLTLTFDTNLSVNNTVTGSSIAARLDETIAGKSGLTDYDSYMVGFNNNYTVAVWSGHNNNDLLIYLNDKKLPKELFYKIFYQLPNINNNYWEIVPNYLTIKETTVLPNVNYTRKMYYLN